MTRLPETRSDDRRRRARALGCAALFVAGVLVPIGGYHVLTSALRSLFSEMVFVPVPEILSEIAPGARPPAGWSGFGVPGDEPVVVLFTDEPEAFASVTLQALSAGADVSARNAADAVAHARPLSPIELRLGARRVAFTRTLRHGAPGIPPRLHVEATVHRPDGRRLHVQASAPEDSPHWREIEALLASVDLRGRSGETR